MSEVVAVAPTATCAGCGTQLAPSLLSCPGCRRLVHGETLTRLAAEADAAERIGEAAAAVERWREALRLLPSESAQRNGVNARLDALLSAATPVPAEAEGGGRSPLLAGGALVAIAGLLWKLKFVIVFLLSKGKLLLLGLTKMSTAGSMLLSLGVYWAAWGWRFAAGVVVSIYVHEMGHVSALRQLGIKASAPMFVPGFGAFVRLHEYPRDEREDAHVGLAGPVWGLGAAIVAYVAFLATGVGLWAGIAKFGALINLFNLLPVWQLDGGRGFRALTRPQRWLAVAAIAAAWAISKEGLLILLLVGAVAATFGTPAKKASWRVLATYAALVAAFTLLATIDLPMPGGR